MMEKKIFQIISNDYYVWKDFYLYVFFIFSSVFCRTREQRYKSNGNMLEKGMRNKTTAACLLQMNEQNFLFLLLFFITRNRVSFGDSVEVS